MPGLSISPELREEQRAEIRLSEQLQTMLELAIEQLVTFRGEIVGETDDRFKEQLERVVVGSSPSAEFAKRVIGDKILLESMIRDMKSLIVPGKIKDFVAGYIFRRDRERGSKRVVVRLDGGEVKIREAILTQAIKNPEGTQQQIGQLLAIAENLQAAGFEELHELQGALQYVNEHKKEIDEVQKNIEGMLSEKVNGVPVILQFLRNEYLLKQLNFTLSERLSKRFVNGFEPTSRSRIKDIQALIESKEANGGGIQDVYNEIVEGEGLRMLSQDQKNCEVSLLNFIADFVLVSAGIISPEVFALKSVKFEEDDPELLDALFAAEGKHVEHEVSAQQAVNHLNLHGGVFFFKRYATLAGKPTALSDLAIRDFKTKTVRTQREAILEAIDYPVWFQKMRVRLAEELRNAAGEEREQTIFKVLFDECSKLFYNENLKNLLKRSIVGGPWNVELLKLCEKPKPPKKRLMNVTSKGIVKNVKK